MILRQILSIFTGIGQKRESEYRSRGVMSWSDLAAEPIGQASLFPSPLQIEIEEAERRYQDRDARYFAELLPRRLHYVLCLEFPEQVTYLDIETTGLSRVYHTLTLVGSAHRSSYEGLLVGRYGDVPDALLAGLGTAPIVVSFNGNLFDLPFLRTRADLPPIVSVDLRFLCFRMGYAGSQKVVEEALGVARPPRFAPLRGEDAPGLWFRAARGDRQALRKLFIYNFYDVRGMAQILERLARPALSHDLPHLKVPTQAAIRRQIHVPKSPSLGPMLAGDVFDRLLPESQSIVRISAVARENDLVVGIDLTGSERRPTAMATIRGTQADTALCGSDEEILSYVMNSGTRLVSIDAPLSLPAGRTTVSDDDPMRAVAGIMRESERELKRRGVNVYPCLLPSMQGLTSRGIRLATQFRERGVATIECYPGAAQDILSMPRKGVGTEFLETSLAETGIDLPSHALNHDELDAVTAAIVGLFFMSDLYEELGDESEEPMIVPLSRRRAGLPDLVVAFSGPIAAGKTTAASSLVPRGFAYGRYSQVIASEVIRRGLSLSRSNLQAVGLDMHERVGQREIGRRLVAELRNEQRVVIDGLRWLSDVAYLRERFGPRLLHVHLDASAEVRRKRHEDQGSLQAFDEVDRHAVESETSQLKALADHVVTNEGDLGSFVATLDQLVKDASGSRDLVSIVELTIERSDRH